MPNLGNPLLRQYLILALLTALAALPNLSPRFRRRFDDLAHRLACWLRGRRLFPVGDPWEAQLRLDAFRIVVAAVGLTRCWGIVSAGVPGTPTYWAGLAWLVLHGLLLFGVLTPLTVVAYLLTNTLCLAPLTNGCADLVTLVFSVAAFPLLLAPAGRRLSVDALLLRLPGPVSKPVERLYAAWGEFHPDRYTLGLFAALVGYWLLCVSSGIHHLEDPEWRSGLVNAWIVLSPRMNTAFHPWADAAYAAWPRGFVGFARFSTWAMLVWEVLLLPLVVYRPTRRLAVAWGLCFFAVAYVVLHLRYLAVIETVLWGMLFLPAWPSRRPQTVPPPVPLGPVPRTWAVSYAALLVPFVLLMPYLKALPGVAALAGLASRTQVVHGLAQVRVFDSREDQYPRYLSMSMAGPGCGPSSNAIDYQIHAWLMDVRSSHLHLLDLALSPRRWQALAPVLPHTGPNPTIYPRLHLTVGPTREDLLAGVYVPFRTHDLFHAAIDLPTNRVLHLRVYDETPDLLLAHAGLPWLPRADGLAWLPRLPDLEELRRIEYWCLHSGQVAQTPEAHAAMHRLWLAMQRHHETHDLLTAICEVVAVCNLDWHPSDAPAPAGGSCEADLVLARAYVNRAFDDVLREKHRPALAAAEAAAARGDVAGCLYHTAGIRRAYFERVFGSHVRLADREAVVRASRLHPRR